MPDDRVMVRSVMRSPPGSCGITAQSSGVHVSQQCVQLREGVEYQNARRGVGRREHPVARPDSAPATHRQRHLQEGSLADVVDAVRSRVHDDQAVTLVDVEPSPGDPAEGPHDAAVCEPAALVDHAHRIDHIRGRRRQPTEWPSIRTQLQRLHVGTFTGPAGVFRRRTEITKPQHDILAKLDLPIPKQIIELDIPA